MITPPPDPTKNLVTVYVPGTPAYTLDNICVSAGDRLILISETLINPAGLPQTDLRPDDPSGALGNGAGYMPHWVYAPEYRRTQDVSDPPPGAPSTNGLNGNAGTLSPIRVDLEYIYCPWRGTVRCEGGMGSLTHPKSFPVVLAYAWDQSSRPQHGWWNTAVELVRRILLTLNNRPVIGGDLTIPRLPVDSARLSTVSTLTFWNAFNQDGIPLPIARPMFASEVWTPGPQTLILDNGPGTTSTNVNVNGKKQPSPLGAYSRVTATSNTAGAIVFNIRY